jgi:hypothetical protein
MPRQKVINIGAAGERGGRLLWCNARIVAGRFYTHCGMSRCGEDFDIPASAHTG